MKQIPQLTLTLLLSLGAFCALGQPAPDFSVTDSHGNPHTLYAGYLNQGKTVLIKIFFTTCPPCNAIAPYMQPLYEDWGAGDFDVEFFELSDKSFDTDPLVNSYQGNHGQTFPGVGKDGGSLEAVAPYKQGMYGPFYGTPTFVVIAPDGTVTYDVRGSNIAETIAFLDTALAATGAQKPPCTITQNLFESICPGDCVEVNGESYCAAGVYTQDLPGSNCDTLLVITVDEQPLITVFTNIEVCENDSVLVGGQWYSENATVVDTLEALIGCDTIETVVITQVPLNTRSIEASYQEGDSIQLYGIWYGMPGTYQIVSPSTTGGCDTIVTMIITEIPNTPVFVSIDGQVRIIDSNIGMENVVVVVMEDTIEVARDTTDLQGYYHFTMDSLQVRSHALQVIPYRSAGPRDGVSALDLVELQKHLLGLKLLNTAPKLLAADANQNGSISVLDLVYLRRLLLGLEDNFPDNKSWIFYPQEATFGPVGLQPPTVEQEPVYMENVLDGIQSGHFKGLKLGNLNG